MTAPKYRDRDTEYQAGRGQSGGHEAPVSWPGFGPDSSGI
jgi:hypothetical protein